MSEFEEPPVAPVSMTLHATIALFVFAFVTVIVLSVTLRVDIVASGRGKVVPVVGVRPVQSEYAARVKRVLVSEGDRVRKGDLLLELDSTDARAQVDSLESELDLKRDQIEIVGTLMETIELLEATVVDPLDDSADDRKDLLEEIRIRIRRSSASPRQRGVTESGLMALERIDNTFRSRLRAARLTTEVTRESLGGVEEALVLQSERHRAAESLLNDGSTSRSEYLDVLDASKALTNRRGVLLRELEQQTAERDVLQAERNDAYAARHSDLADRRAELSAERDVIGDSLRSARKRLRDSKLHSPLDGTVGSVSALVRGGVVEAGAELLRVVPENTSPKIEALFENADIGFLEVGQRTNISFDAFPSARFGTVHGTLTRVSADAQQGPSEDSWRFAAQVVPDRCVLVIEGSEYPMRPGMTVAVDVATGSRRLISYFLAPIVDTLRSSMQER